MTNQTQTPGQLYALAFYPNPTKVRLYYRGSVFGMPTFGTKSQAVTFETVNQALQYMAALKIKRMEVVAL